MVRVNEVRVNTTGADFVFAKDYNLRSPDETEKYIKEHKHLRETATANEMAREGMAVGVMNTKLLQKIEELTLYLIEQNKKLTELQYRVSALKEEK